MSAEDEESLPDFVFEAQLLPASHAVLSKMYEDEHQSKARHQHQVNLLFQCPIKESGMDVVKTVVLIDPSLKKIFKMLVSLQDKMAEEEEGSTSKKMKKLKRSPKP
ncbi:hypothetical protein M9H77_25989 [Catharanthus roseus]|uniref:Uncharacterized protein n=1 Tax=Catharanthus roseus TaxID=4058 RepID=A0ACC0ACG8_CATRO|nr:hypothetical protein M9H77_25989 [Catharanthus roseus]